MNFLKLFFYEIYSRRRSILMSVAIAFVAWIVTIICTDRYSVVVIKDVPVTVNLTNTQTEQLGLYVVKVSPFNVSVKLKGPRGKLATITNKDLVVTPVSFKNIIGTGDFDVDLKCDLKQAQPDVVVEKIDSSLATLTVDVFATKLVDVVCELPDIQAEEGYVLDTPVCQPKNLYVGGPKKVVDCLDKVQLDVNSLQKNLNSTKTFDAQPKFIASDGSELKKSVFKYNEAVKFNVTVPIYIKKQVPLTFLFKNAPSCLNLDLLKYVINPDKIVLGVSNEVASVKELSMGYIDMRQLDFNNNFNFNVTVPAGFRNLSQIDSASVIFNKSDWNYKTFYIDDIQLINFDDSFDVKIKSAVLEKVKIIGIKGFIDNVNKHDITATVDLSSVKLKPGEQNVPVNIGILNKDGVWPVGFYSCSIECKKT